MVLIVIEFLRDCYVMWLDFGSVTFLYLDSRGPI